MDSSVGKNRSVKSRLARIFELRRLRNHPARQTLERPLVQNIEAGNTQKEKVNQKEQGVIVGMRKRRMHKLIVRESSERDIIAQTSIHQKCASPLNNSSIFILCETHAQTTIYQKPDETQEMLSTSIPRRTLQSTVKSESVSNNHGNATSQHRLHETMKCVLNNSYILIFIAFFFYYLLSKSISLNRYTLLFLGFVSALCSGKDHCSRIACAFVIIFDCYSIIRTLYCLVILDITLYNIFSLALLSGAAVFGYYIKDDKNIYDNLPFMICIGDIIIRGITINVYYAVFIGLIIIIVFILMYYAAIFLLKVFEAMMTALFSLIGLIIVVILNEILSSIFKSIRRGSRR